MAPEPASQSRLIPPLRNSSHEQAEAHSPTSAVLHAVIPIIVVGQFHQIPESFFLLQQSGIALLIPCACSTFSRAFDSFSSLHLNVSYIIIR